MIRSRSHDRARRRCVVVDEWESSVKLYIVAIGLSTVMATRVTGAFLRKSRR